MQHFYKYTTSNTASQKYVLNNDLKWFIVLALFVLSGNPLHRTGPAKDLSPDDLSLDDLSDLPDGLMDINLRFLSCYSV